MTTDIRVYIEYDEKEIGKAIIELMNKIYYAWVIFPCAALAIGGVLLAGFRKGFSTYINGLLLMFIFSTVLAVYYFYIRYINGYKSVYKLKKEVTFIFSQKIIEAQSNYTESKIKWDVFKQVLETKCFFFLLDRSRVFTILPKRFFDNDEAIQGFRNIVAEIETVKYKKY